MATPPEGAEPARKSRLPLAMLVAVIILVAAGLGAYLAFFSAPGNRPPVAAFTYTVDGLTVDFEASGSNDPDGTVVSHDWDFGDGDIDTGLVASHRYDAPGTFEVTLTVADDDGTTGRTTEDVTLSDLPVAKFVVDRDLMAVQVDASASYAPAGTITAYAWSFGDAGTGTGVTAAHAYAVPGKYTITLTVTDSAGNTGATTRVTSVAHRTLDTVMYDFFNISYGEWWYLREAGYGDKIVSNQWPHFSVYPWAGQQDYSDAFVYTIYRMAVSGRNLTEFTIEHPAMLPLFGPPSAQGTRVDVHWYAQYIDTARQQQLALEGFPVPDGFMDGFAEEWHYAYAMDYNATRRFFNVSGDPAAWWAANTTTGPSQGPLESRWQIWLETLGKETFNVWSAFEWPYTMFQFDVNATVITNPDGSNTTELDVLLISWGQEVLTARWFYWGTGSYPNGTPVARNGWWPQELGWFEDFTFDGTLYWDHADFDWDAAMGYQFIELALPGPDGQFQTADDEPVWSWYPQLMDYIYSDVRNPKSELDAWFRPGTRDPYTAINAHPGNPYYGTQYQVDQAYLEWDLLEGQTVAIILPKDPVVFHDPFRSTWNPTTKVPNFVNITAPMTLRRMTPANVGTWDEASKTFFMAGPFEMGGAMPLFDGLPRIDFGPKR